MPVASICGLDSNNDAHGSEPLLRISYFAHRISRNDTEHACARLWQSWPGNVPAMGGVPCLPHRVLRALRKF